MGRGKSRSHSNSEEAGPEEEMRLRDSAGRRDWTLRAEAFLSFFCW